MISASHLADAFFVMGILLTLNGILKINHYRKHPPGMLWHKRFEQSKIAWFFIVGLANALFNGPRLMNGSLPSSSIYDAGVNIFAALLLIDSLFVVITGILYQRNKELIDGRNNKIPK